MSIYGIKMKLLLSFFALGFIGIHFNQAHSVENPELGFRMKRVKKNIDKTIASLKKESLETIKTKLCSSGKGFRDYSGVLCAFPVVYDFVRDFCYEGQENIVGNGVGLAEDKTLQETQCYTNHSKNNPKDAQITDQSHVSDKINEANNKFSEISKILEEKDAYRILFKENDIIKLLDDPYILNWKSAETLRIIATILGKDELFKQIKSKHGNIAEWIAKIILAIHKQFFKEGPFEKKIKESTELINKKYLDDSSLMPYLKKNKDKLEKEHNAFIKADIQKQLKALKERAEQEKQPDIANDDLTKIVKQLDDERKNKRKEKEKENKKVDVSAIKEDVKDIKEKISGLCGASTKEQTQEQIYIEFKEKLEKCNKRIEDFREKYSEISYKNQPFLKQNILDLLEVTADLFLKRNKGSCKGFLKITPREGKNPFKSKALGIFKELWEENKIQEQDLEDFGITLNDALNIAEWVISYEGGQN